MSVGGGETLRAVMSKNAVYSQPAMYVIPLNARNGTAAARATTRGVLQTNDDLWFLATSLVPTVTGGFGFLRVSAPEFIRLFDPADNSDFARVPLDMQASLLGDTSLNNPHMLPEYILWPPSSVIGVEWAGINYVGVTEFKFLTLLGIEYGMPDRLSGS